MVKNCLYIKCPSCETITEINMEATTPQKKYVYVTESKCRICHKVVTVKFEITKLGIRLIFVGDEE